MSANDTLARIEPWIDELARKFERYFARDPKVPVPPERERTALERQLRELSRAENPNPSERFRLEQLMHRFSTYNNLWQRQLREREEARVASGSGARVGERSASPNAGSSASVPGSDEYERLFVRYRTALGKAGREPNVTFERFRQALVAQRQQLEAKGAAVEGFEVVDDGGQVKVTVRVRRGRKE